MSETMFAVVGGALSALLTYLGVRVNARQADRAAASSSVTDQVSTLVSGWEQMVEKMQTRIDKAEERADKSEERARELDKRVSAAEARIDSVVAELTHERRVTSAWADLWRDLSTRWAWHRLQDAPPPGITDIPTHP